MITWFSLQIVKQGLSLIILDHSPSTNKNKMMTLLLVYTTIICKGETCKISFFITFQMSARFFFLLYKKRHWSTLPVIPFNPVRLGQNEGLKVRMIIFQEFSEHCIRIDGWKAKSLRFKSRILPTISMPQISSKSSSTIQSVWGLDLFLIPRDVLNCRRWSLITKESSANLHELYTPRCSIDT